MEATKKHARGFHETKMTVACHSKKEISRGGIFGHPVFLYASMRPIVYVIVVHFMSIILSVFRNPFPYSKHNLQSIMYYLTTTTHFLPVSFSILYYFVLFCIIFGNVQKIQKKETEESSLNLLTEMNLNL